MNELELLKHVSVQAHSISQRFGVFVDVDNKFPRIKQLMIDVSDALINARIDDDNALDHTVEDLLFEASCAVEQPSVREAGFSVTCHDEFVTILKRFVKELDEWDIERQKMD